MIQILALRGAEGSKRKIEVWFEKRYRAESVEQLFEDPTPFLAQIPESERYNVYYTVAECLEESGRKLLRQYHIPFDLDGIEVPPPGEEEQLRPLANMVCEELGLDPRTVGILFSGNGLQFIVGIEKPIEDENYFDEVRTFYKAACDKVESRLRRRGIQGEMDSSVWSKARLMRMPCTENRKLNKPARIGYILNAQIERGSFDIKQASGIPKVAVGDAIVDSIAKSFPSPDNKTMLADCNFLRWCQVAPEEVHEPQWYAMLSIASRMNHPEKMIHELSKGHPAYTYEETELKGRQANVASGPRTCKNLQDLAGKCAGCKWNGKIQTPLQIEGEDHIKTESTGFRFVKMTDNGPSIGKPDTDGLFRYFRKTNTYISIRSSGEIYLWDRNVYVSQHKKDLTKDFYNKFRPPTDLKFCDEVYNVVKIHNTKPADWFIDSTRGKMNFQNGVLDIASGVLSPHNPDVGFASILDCAYDANADCPTFKKFVQDITCGHESLAKILQEFLGYTFSNSGCKYEKALLLVGEGSNGKSTLVNVIRALSGTRYTSNLSFNELGDQTKRHMLYGKMINVSEENNWDAFRNTEIIKNLVSGGVTSGKQLYVDVYEFRNQAKFIMLCNSMPRLQDHTLGFYRKLIMIPFNATFSDEAGNKDVDILSKILNELPGIFNWAMEGFRRLEASKKFTESSEVADLAEEVHQDENNIHGWFVENCEYASMESFAFRDELYEDYRLWCDAGGERAKSKKAVLKTVRHKLMKKFKDQAVEVRRDGKRALVGVSLVEKSRV